MDDVRGVRLGEVFPIHRQPQREAEVANAALLEQHRLGAVADPGDLDQWDFERNAHGLIVLGDSHFPQYSGREARPR